MILPGQIAIAKLECLENNSRTFDRRHIGAERKSLKKYHDTTNHECTRKDIHCYHRTR